MAVADWTGTVIDWKVALADLKQLIAQRIGRPGTAPQKRLDTVRPLQAGFLG
jgi:hypothetical protein